MSDKFEEQQPLVAEDTHTAQLIGGALHDPSKVAPEKLFADLSSSEIFGVLITATFACSSFWMNTMLYYHNQNSLLTGGSMYFIGCWYCKSAVERVTKPAGVDYDPKLVQRNEMMASMTWMFVSIMPHMQHSKIKYTGRNLGTSFIASTFFSLKYAYLHFSLADLV